LYELQTQLEICINLNFLDESVVAGMIEKSREIERMLSSLIAKVQNSQK
jgi:four helix bundle protein